MAAVNDKTLPETAGSTTHRVARRRQEPEPAVWLCALALSIIVLMVLIPLGVIIYNGARALWPRRVAEVHLADGTRLLGEAGGHSTNPHTHALSLRFKTGNRELDPSRLDFHWVEQASIARMLYPPAVVALERTENGNFYGRLLRLRTPGFPSLPGAANSFQRLSAAVAAAHARARTRLLPLRIRLGDLAHRLADIHDRVRRCEYALRHTTGSERRQALRADIAKLRQASRALRARSDRVTARQREAELELQSNVAILSTIDGREVTIPLVHIMRAWRPNAMGLPARCALYGSRLWELLTAQPREANTEGGLFPAIFGTVMLVMLMAVGSFPLGVIAGIHLGVYARDGLLLRIMRIAINNLAGIPSIVYGIFGLGFFVYGVGGAIDRCCYPAMHEAGTPVFGTGGVLWASLTLGLLTVPVVIVATEEALRAIPASIKQGSLAMGATPAQTLWRVLLPMASPGIMTGFILAMARAAGEVAPLMLTGVVKSAPALAVDGRFPFLHLERKFMHLGFHIYDLAFKSPNSEAALPMVYLTTLLLLVLVLVLSSLAIWQRNRMQQRNTRTL